MAPESGEKADIGMSKQRVGAVITKAKDEYWVIIRRMLRVVALFASVSATVVMATNKETKTLVMATIGTTPIQATLTAKFQHNPSFVFFVITNGMASLHNLLMLAVDLLGPKIDLKGIRFVIIAILDMMIVGLVSGGASGAAFMGELGRNGNSHAKWNKICDKFNTFCDHGGGAIIASFIALLLLMIINAISIIKLQTQSSRNCSVLP